jgi:eukaryotic-like serine/threonine-protein kinase
MSSSPGVAYEFGPFRLEPSERRLLRDGEDVSLPPKALDLLVALASRPGRLVKKEALLEEVWPGVFVEEANLSYTVSLLRRAIEGGNGDQRYIDTVPKQGYRFKADVRAVAGAEATHEGVPHAPDQEADGPQTSIPVATDAQEAVARPRRQWGYIAIGVGVVALAAFALIAAVHRRVDDPPIFSAPARFDVAVPEGINLSLSYRPEISPDGRRVAFVAWTDGHGQIWIKRLDSATMQPIPGTDEGILPFWSPDSRWIGFFAQGKLKRVDPDGGPVLTVCELPRESQSSQWRTQRGIWNSSGVILFSIGRVYRVSDTGGVPQPVTDVDVARSEAQHAVMGFLSDGRRFIFSEIPHPGTFFVSSLDSPRDRDTLTIGAPGDGITAVATTSGFLLYAKRGAILAQPFDDQSLRFTGPATTIADGAWSSPSASRSGIVMFQTAGYPLMQLTWRGRDGSSLGVVGVPDTYLQVELSPTNRRAAVVRGGSWPLEMDIWLADLTSGLFSNLTAYSGLESDPQWSPDERRLAFTSTRDGPWAPFMKDLVTGKEEKLIDEQQDLPVDDWTNDGRFLLVRSKRRALYALPVSGERKLQLLAETSHGEDETQVSPDGKWVAFNTTSPGAEVYVARFPSLTDRRQVSPAGGAQPRWRRDGRELFYISNDGTLMTVETAPDGEFPFRQARPLFMTALEKAHSAEMNEYDVSADGQRFLILERKRRSAKGFTFLVNWTQGLKSSVPAPH